MQKTLHVLLVVLFSFQFLFQFPLPAEAATNRAPTANAQSVSTNEDASVAIVLTGSDPEGAALSYSVSAGPYKGSLSCSGPQCVYTPVANLYGTDFFNFKVSDGSLTSRAARVSITINAVNDAPTATSASYTMNEDSGWNIIFQGNDTEKDSLSYSLVSQPSMGTFSFTSGNAGTYSPFANRYGQDSFSFVANDGKASSAPATITMTVNAVNDAPTAADQAVSMDEGATLVLDVVTSLGAEDVDGNALTAVIGYAGNSITAVAGQGTITVTPDVGFVGSDSFTYRVTDGTAYSGTATVSVTVNAVLSPVSFEVSSGGTAIIPFTQSTDEADALTFNILSQPAHGVATKTDNNTFTYEAGKNYSGSDTFTFSASNGTTVSVGTVNVKILAPGSYTPVSEQALEPLPVSTQKNGDLTVISLGSDGCYHFEASPLVLPGVGAIEYIVGTLFSSCLNYVDVPHPQFFVRADTGETFQASSAVDSLVEPNAFASSTFDGNTLVTPLMSTGSNVADPDEPTGGLFIQQFKEDGSVDSSLSDPFAGRGISGPVLIVDDMIPASSYNTNKPVCQRGAKLEAENCGVWGFVHALSKNVAALVFPEDNGYEAHFWGASRAMVKDNNGTVTYDRIVWGNGTGGNNWDSLNVGGGCRVNMVDKIKQWESIANGTFAQFDFFANDLSGVKFFDPGDAGCTDGSSTVNNGDTVKSAVQKTVIGFNPQTKRPIVWAQGYQPDTFDGEYTRINAFDENLNPVCDLELRSGKTKNPFNGVNTSLVIDDAGFAYVNADTLDDNGVFHTSILKISPTDCSYQTLLDYKVGAVGSFSGLTLATVGGSPSVLAATPGYLHVLNLNTLEDALYELGSTALVSAAPVVTSAGQIVTMDTSNVMSIRSGLNAAYFGFWSRPGHDNWGSNTAVMVLP